MWSIGEIKAEARDFIRKHYLVSLGVALCMIFFGMYNNEKFFEIRNREFIPISAENYDRFMQEDIRDLLLTKTQREWVETIKKETKEVYRDPQIVIVRMQYTGLRQFTSTFLNSPWSKPYNFLVMKTFLPYGKEERVSIALISSLLLVIIKALICNPIAYGGYSFFLRGVQGEVSFSNILNAFREGDYLRIVRTMFLRDLIIFFSLIFFVIFSIAIYFGVPFALREMPSFSLDIRNKFHLLFLIVGILFVFISLVTMSLPFIKLYEYSMIPFILDEEGDLSPSEVLRRSKELTRGHKKKMLFLDISFVHWYLLGNLLFLIGRVFMHPYYLSTKANLYLALTEMDMEESFQV